MSVLDAARKVQLTSLIEKLAAASEKGCIMDEKDFDETKSDFYSGVKDGAVIMARDILYDLIEIFDADGDGSDFKE